MRAFFVYRITINRGINMKKQYIATVIFVFLPVFSHASTHFVSLSAGNTDFSWEEFDVEDGHTINQEGGILTLVSALYSYQENNKLLSVSLSNTNGDISYLGEKRKSQDKIKYPTSTDYQIREIELSFGKYFYTDYIKPYAYIYGGYQDRERIINQSPDFTQRGAEKYSFYFWGVGMDAELFNWNSFAISSGVYFKNYAHGEITLIDERNHTSPLSQLITTGFKFDLSYTFSHNYKASVTYKSGTGKMDISSESKYFRNVNGVEAYYPYSHPESRQTYKQILATIGMYF